MGKRGNGEGPVYKRKSDGKWVASITLGVHPDGKPNRKTVYGKTPKEAREKLQALQTELMTGGVVDPARITVAEYLEQWLRDVVKHTIRPTTLESYTQKVRVHVLPTLGKMQLSKLLPLHLQQLYSERLSAGKSKRTVQYVHAVIHKALKHAVRQGMITRNPADAVEVPRPDRKEMQVLTPEQLARLIQSMEGYSLQALYYLAIATGCRRGELVALRRSDVDWSRPAISINRTAEEITGEVIWTEPKTAKSRRSVPLPSEAVNVLKAHRAKQAQQKLMSGAEYEDRQLVFAKKNGHPISPSQVSHHFTLLLDKAELPRVRLHDLRYSHATMLLAAGVHPKIVSERLGHSTITLTMDTYSHVLPTMQDEVTKKLDAMLPAKVAQHA